MKEPQSKSSPSQQRRAQKQVKAAEGYQDRNLAALNDGGESLAPTDAEPVNLHKRMAGAC